MTRSQVRRVLRQAAKAWHARRPHEAWRIMAENGLESHFHTFTRKALDESRQRYEYAMTLYTD